MRARHRSLVAALFTAVVIALASGPGASSVQAEDHYCPNGTSWDNKLQRCV